MAVRRPDRDVMVIGIGLHPFGRFPEKDLATLGLEAVNEALRDAGLQWKDIPIVYVGHAYDYGISIGTMMSSRLGLTGIPIVNVANACASGATAFWQAYWNVAVGLCDIVLAVGAEKVPRGPAAMVVETSPHRYIGADYTAAVYALRMRRYLEETGAPLTSMASVAVKAYQNAAMHPYAPCLETYTVEEVLDSRVIADPLTLHQYSSVSEGAAAAVLCARDALGPYGLDSSKAIRVAASVLCSGTYQGVDRDPWTLSPHDMERAALDAYHMSGFAPQDIDIVQVYDAATIGELENLEALHLLPYGEAWKAAVEGRTSLLGSLPTNTDGGVLALGNPLGATGLRMIHEIVIQLRHAAGVRQAQEPCVGLAQCSGAGNVTAIHILTR